jgi:hypothetical protein
MATAVYPTMQPQYNDPEQVLLVKACYWAQSISEDNGGVPGTALYPNMAGNYNDPSQVLLVKLTYWLASIQAGLDA